MAKPEILSWAHGPRAHGESAVQVPVWPNRDLIFWFTGLWINVETIVSLPTWLVTKLHYLSPGPKAHDKPAVKVYL